MPVSRHVLRGCLLDFRADPFRCPEEKVVGYEQDAVIVMEGGRIREVGPAGKIIAGISGDMEVDSYPGCLLLPGFVDAHAHYPQTDMIASRGRDLLDWLERHTFPAEVRHMDPEVARGSARAFLGEQVRHGITTSAVFCTSAPASVEVFLAEAEALGVRTIAGKVCMDRHAPVELLDTPERAYRETRALLEAKRSGSRGEVAITPRFAPTSSEEQLEALGALAREFPAAPIQSHIAETLREVAWVKDLFPSDATYTEVYARHGLLRKRALFGHGVHLDEGECARFHETGAAVVHCPSANFFLGSGCMDVGRIKAESRPLGLAVGSDIGAGTGFSMLHTLSNAYLAAQASGATLTPVQAFYLATRGGAEALGLEERVGSLRVGMDADVVVLDPRATPLLGFRSDRAESVEDLLFALMMLGDDRAVAATYSAGKRLKPA